MVAAFLLGIALSAFSMGLTALLGSLILVRNHRRAAIALLCGSFLFLRSDPQRSAEELAHLPTEGTVCLTGLEKRKGERHYVFSYAPAGRRKRFFLSDQTAREDASMLSPNGTVDPEELLSHRYAVRVTFQPFTHPSLPGEYHEAHFYAAKGMSGLLRLEEASALPETFPTARVRQHVLDFLESKIDTIGEPASLFLKRILLGSGSVESFPLQQEMKTLGLSHLLAASGLHVGLLFSWGLWLVAWIPWGRRGAVSFLFLVLFGYAFLLDFPSSILRALLFQFFCEVSILAKRPYSHIKRIALALSVILFFQPYRIYDLGLQLSFACAIAMEVAGQLERRSARKSLIFSSFCFSFWMNFLTLPFLAQAGLSVTTASFVANLFTIPLFSVVFAAGLLALFSGGFPVLGSMLTALFQGLYALFTALIEGLGALPFPSFQFLFRDVDLACYALIGIVLYTFQSGLLRRFLSGSGSCFLSDLSYERRKQKAMQTFLVGGALMTILSSLFVSCLPPRLTAINVGQGDAFLLQVDGKNLLIDTGGRMDYRTKKNEQAEELAAALLNAGMTHLDAVFLSHDDYDHDGNLEELSRHLPIDRVFTAPGVGLRSFGRSEWQTVKTGEIYLLAPSSLFHGEVTLQVLQEGIWDDEEKNDHCMILLLHMGGDVLFLGDQENTDALPLSDLSPLALLKVAHHGSRKGTSESLLQTTMPERAVISVGNQNRYGHPNAETLERLHEFGTRTDRTDDAGSITYIPNPFPFGKQLFSLHEKETLQIQGLYGFLEGEILCWAVLRVLHFLPDPTKGDRV